MQKTCFCCNCLWQTTAVVQYAGDKPVFKALEKLFLEGLPQEPVEWTRSYGRGPKTVRVECRFVEYDVAQLSREKDGRLLDQAHLHVYCTDCNDLETYRSRVRDEIIEWMSQLKEAGICDWMLIAVELTDARRANKAKLLSRATVFDRMRADFPSKNFDRCVQVYADSSGSVQAALLGRLRQLLLHATGRLLGRYEELIRTQRERRTVPNWSFLHFFFLQEELAFVLEALGLYDEALVQYDELDALFTQVVINSASGEMPEWLCQLAQLGCEAWGGLQLGVDPAHSPERQLLLHRKGSLLQLRNYLFSRQCALLRLQNRASEMASRTLSFLHNTVHELAILEVTTPPGAVACWVFTSCLEVLSACEGDGPTEEVAPANATPPLSRRGEKQPQQQPQQPQQQPQQQQQSTMVNGAAYSLHTVGLWSYAREKLKQLGELCGLMPGRESTSEQLLMVITLLSGMQSLEAELDSQSPHSQLREALSSKESFLKHYLDLSEHTMIMFKHTGRLRSARLVGRDLAELYMQLGEPQKAVPFLVELVRSQADEGWHRLAAIGQRRLLDCYAQTCEWGRYVRTALALAACSALPMDERLQLFEEVQPCMQNLREMGDGPVALPMEGLVSLEADEASHALPLPASTVPRWAEGSEVELSLTLTSQLPATLKGCILTLHLNRLEAPPSVTNTPTQKHRGRWSWLASSGRPGGWSPRMAVLLPRAATSPAAGRGSSSHHNAGSVGLVCSNLPTVPPPAPCLTNASGSSDTVEFQLQGVDLVPGLNRFTFHHKVSQVGYYVGRQLDLRWEQLSLAQLTLGGGLTSRGARLSMARPPAFTIYYDSPKVALHFPQGELLAGVRQRLEVVLTSGSIPLTAAHQLHLKASKGLLIRPSHRTTDSKAEEASSECPLPSLSPLSPPFADECRVPVGEPGLAASSTEGRTFSLVLQAPLGPSSSPATHQVALAVENSDGVAVLGSSQTVALHFLAPFACSHRLQTFDQRKYLQVNLQGLTSQPFTVGNATLLALDNEPVYLKPLHSSSQLLRVSPAQMACFLWELLNAEGQPLRLSFSVLYAHGTGEDRVENSFSHTFRIEDYQTLYTVRVRVEPQSGAEFCRTDCACSLHVQICQLQTTAPSAIMYELVPDATAWAVLGRTAGVLQLSPEQREQTVMLEVKPLQVGFLPVPTVRLSRYIPPSSSGGTPSKSMSNEGSSAQGTAKLEPFLPGQIYNWSRATQVHVLAPSTSSCEPPG
ncbi:trafficking protein particle complex subunit 10 isoform X1 [Dermacentor andersoni]|uniref:trafficking protein particle complex subunit 10 isoform X1 n=1 Tax=Dermacentor andersoni TaxID=34620 RepID=UPI00241754F6|nr:trafficking protein particle complex subunit 10-like isoform X1 [Dermacentor andersoni]